MLSTASRHSSFVQNELKNEVGVSRSICALSSDVTCWQACEKVCKSSISCLTEGKGPLGAGACSKLKGAFAHLQSSQVKQARSNDQAAEGRPTQVLSNFEVIDLCVVVPAAPQCGEVRVRIHC